MDRYATAAEVLRMLSAAEPITLNGRDDPLRTMLRLGAEACERSTDAENDRAQAIGVLTEVRALLIQIVDELDGLLAFHDDLSPVYALARRALARSAVVLALNASHPKPFDG
jgi:hypothetical protein